MISQAAGFMHQRRPTRDIDIVPANCIGYPPAAVCLDDVAAQRPNPGHRESDDMRLDVVLLEGCVP